MAQPAWDKIPFEKLPQWKKEEMLGKAKKTVEELESVVTEFVCDVCSRTFGSEHGLKIHKSSHK